MSKQEKPIQVTLKKKREIYVWVFPPSWFFNRSPRVKDLLFIAIALLIAYAFFWILSILLPLVVIAILAYFVYRYLKEKF